jgi:hypothetical protein
VSAVCNLLEKLFSLYNKRFTKAGWNGFLVSLDLRIASLRAN